MYDFLGIYFTSASGMRHACDAGTTISLAGSGAALVRSVVFYASSGHHCIAYIWRGAGFWLFVDFTYRSIPFLLSCIYMNVGFHLNAVVTIREAKREVWGSGMHRRGAPALQPKNIRF
jgi:hypothetical protein